MTAVSERRISILDHEVTRMLDPIQMGVVLRLRGRGQWFDNLLAASLFPLGRTGKTLRGLRGGAKLQLHPGRVALFSRAPAVPRYARTTPARVFLPRRSTARPPARPAPSKVAPSSSTFTLLR